MSTNSLPRTRRSLLAAATAAGALALAINDGKIKNLGMGAADLGAVGGDEARHLAGKSVHVGIGVGAVALSKRCRPGQVC